MTETTRTIMDYKFIGPYPTKGIFNPVAGVYIISAPKGNIIDVGETDNLKERIPGHERAECWSENAGISLWFHYENNRSQRLAKEKEIRDAARPVCGFQ